MPSSAPTTTAISPLSLHDALPICLTAEDACDVLVSWRRPDAHSMNLDARQKVLWCHDLHYGPEAAEHMGQWDVVLGVSGWHAEMLGRYYGVAADHVPNGIDMGRFPEDVSRKAPFQCVYASSPDRGLLKLLNLWPDV